MAEGLRGRRRGGAFGDARPGEESGETNAPAGPAPAGGSPVVVTRHRHPLEGQSLAVLGRMCRHGRVELLVVLPDGSKSLLPADWTDLHHADGGQQAAATLGSLADLLAAVEVRTGITERGRTGNG